MPGNRSAQLLLSLLLALFVLAPSDATAHRPYFTSSVPCTFNGDANFQMRILRGDGIIVADPASVLIVGADRHLLASVQASPSVVVRSDTEGRCEALDMLSDKVFTPDPASFESGRLVPDGLDEERNMLWYPGDVQDRGFSIAPMTLSENVLAFGLLLAQGPGELAVFALLALGLVAAFTSGIRELTSKGPVAVRVFWSVLALMLAIVLLAAYYFLFIISTWVWEMHALAVLIGIAGYSIWRFARRPIGHRRTTDDVLTPS